MSADGYSTRRIIDQADLDSPRQELSNVGLGIVVALTVFSEIVIFCRLIRDVQSSLANALRKVLCLYASGGFFVRHAMMDMEFEKVKDLVPLVEENTAAALEHVCLIEQAIRHLKEKVRATTSEFPFA